MGISSTWKKIRANRRYWTDDLFENGLGDVGMKGRAVFRMSDLSVRENLAGENAELSDHLWTFKIDRVLPTSDNGYLVLANIDKNRV